jgi:hypothetical protein
MLHGCTRSNPLCSPGTSGVLPLYTLRGNWELPSPGAGWASGAGVAPGAMAFAGVSVCGALGDGLDETGWALYAMRSMITRRVCQPSGLGDGTGDAAFRWSFPL